MFCYLQHSLLTRLKCVCFFENNPRPREWVGTGSLFVFPLCEQASSVRVCLIDRTGGRTTRLHIQLQFFFSFAPSPSILLNGVPYGKICPADISAVFFRLSSFVYVSDEKMERRVGPNATFRTSRLPPRAESFPRMSYRRSRDGVKRLPPFDLKLRRAVWLVLTTAFPFREGEMRLTPPSAASLLGLFG